jgi:hypothetical protein
MAKMIVAVAIATVGQVATSTTEMTIVFNNAFLVALNV